MKNILLLINNCISFTLLFILKIIIRKNIRASDRILFIHTAGFGDLLFSSCLIERSNELSYKDVFFLVKKEHHDLFEDYTGSIRFIFIDYEKYRYNLFYRIRFQYMLKNLRIKEAFLLNMNRNITDDCIALNSAALSIIALCSNDNNYPKAFKEWIDTMYTRILYAFHVEERIKYLSLLNMIANGRSAVIKPTVFINEAKRESILKSKLSADYDKKQYIVINPYSSSSIRNWNDDRFVKLIKEMITEFSTNIFVIGIEKQFRLIDSWTKNLDGVQNLCGKLSVLDSSCLIKKARLFIGVDSGMSHVARIFGTPRIIISGGGPCGLFIDKADYNNNDKNQVLLYHQTDCFGCNWICKHEETFCISKITVDQVMVEVRNLLKKN